MTHLPDRMPRAMVAATRRILPDDKESVRMVRRREAWQSEAWDYHDLLGEVGFVSMFIGEAMSRLTLVAADPEQQGPEGPEPVEDPFVDDAIARLDQGEGIPELLRDGAVNLTIAAEMYLHGTGEEGAEAWSIRSVDEVSADGAGHVTIRDYPSHDGHRLGDDEVCERIWRRHPRFGQLAWAPLRSALSSCEELLKIEAAVRASLVSRVPAGLLLIPDSFSFGPADPTVDEGDGEARQDPFMADLETALLTPIQDEGSAGAVVPTMVRGPADEIEKAKHLLFSRPLDEQLDERTERALRRLAQGLELPPEVTLGIADVNHWNAWMVDRQTVQMHRAKAGFLCRAFTRAYLWPALREANRPLNRVLWFDDSAWTRPTPTSDDADEAHDRYVISDAAYRRMKGWDDKDAPDEDEVRRRVAIRAATGAPSLAEGLLDDTTGEGPPNAGDEPVEPSASLTAASKSLDGLVDALMDIDRSLADRLHGAADQAVRRVLERVGSALRTRASRQDASLKQAVARVDSTMVAATLGQAVVDTLAFAIDDETRASLAPLGRRFDAWVGQAQSQARVEAAAALGVDVADLGELEAVQADDRREAWGWLETALVGLVAGLLFDPSPKLQGEAVGDVRVPYTTITEALSRAGGGARAIAGVVRDAAVSVKVRGAALSVRLLNLLSTFGIVEAELQWSYRAWLPRNSFPPHQALDGVRVAAPEDPELANSSSFPRVGRYYPGDHTGCRCTWRPVLVRAET